MPLVKEVNSVIQSISLSDVKTFWDVYHELVVDLIHSEFGDQNDQEELSVKSTKNSFDLFHDVALKKLGERHDAAYSLSGDSSAWIQSLFSEVFSLAHLFVSFLLKNCSLVTSSTI